MSAGQRIFVHYHAGDVWHERCLLREVALGDSNVWIVLTPDMNVYAEDLNFNLEVKVAGPGNSVPRGIGRGQAYRFDPAFPSLGEFEAYQEIADDYLDEETRRIAAEGYVRRSTGRVAREGDGGDPDDGGDDDGGEAGDHGEEDDADDPAGGKDGTWRVFSLGGALDYGDECTPPTGAVTAGGAKMWVLEGKPIAAKRVKDDEFEDFMAAVASQDAQILPISRGRGGRRYKSWVRLSEECAEADVADWPLNGARTAAWCLEYLVRMGQTIESHHEDFVCRSKLERNSWGVNAHWQSSNFIKCLGETDQCDLLNLVSAEAAFR
ncbi:MAG: hypothetical protein L7S64_02420 [Longimicrobiales bacterium]|nr:hypothetical protein [Longimicrobiales bacterium]